MTNRLLIGDLAQFLIRDAGVSAIIGVRCYPAPLPQSPVYPALSYGQIDAVRVRAVEGPAGKVRRRVQIDSWAKTNPERWELADAVRTALDGFRGMMGSTEIGSVDMQNETAFFEEQAGTVGIYRVAQDFIIGHLEA